MEPATAANGVDGRIFWTSFAIIVTTGTFYLAFIAAVGARVSLFVLLSALLGIAPAVVWCERRGRHTLARLLFVFGTNYYIAGMVVGLGHEAQCEVYLFPAMTLGILIFPPIQKRCMAFCLILPMLTWVLVTVEGQLGLAPPPVGVATVVLRAISFIGALLVASALLLAARQIRGVDAQAVLDALAQAKDSKNHLRGVLDTERERRMILDQIMENIPVAVTLRELGNGLRVVEWSRQVESMTGIMAAAAIGRTVRELFPGEQGDAALKRDQVAIASGRQEDEIIAVNLRGSSEHTHLRTRRIPILPTGDGSFRYLLTITDDITVFKRNEATIQRAERAASERGSRMHSLFQAMTEGMVTVAPDGVIGDCNEAASRILGHSTQALVGRDVHQLLPAPDSGDATVRIGSAIDLTLRTGRTYHRQQDRLMISGGKVLPVRYSCTPIKLGNDIVGALMTFSDLTTELMMNQTIEQQRMLMIASSKMSSLGEMAAGVAHEINNPLAVIVGRANQMSRILRRESVDVETIINGLTQIEGTAQRIAKIIRGLLAFSRSGERAVMEEASIHRIIADTLDLCQARFVHHGIEVRGFPPPAGALEQFLECRPIELAQVLMNLLGNAHDAVEHLTERWVEIELAATVDQLIIKVTDSGSGIPEGVVRKMMEPFYTTKEVGRGTGLGLSLSKGILEDHQGSLEYDATCAHTRFVITLPLKQQRPSLAAG